MEANKKFSGWFRWMSLIVLAGSSILLFLAAKPQNDKFSKYKSIEAYEIRPGILMMPRYADDGQVCEIGLERWHYRPNFIDMDSGLERKDIDEIVDEITPIDERGPQPKDTSKRGAGFIAGRVIVMNEEYENIEIQIYRSFSGHIDKKHQINMSNSENIAAIVKWKNRKCQ